MTNSFQEIPIMTMKLPNNTDGMNRIYFYLLLSVPNKCHPDGQTTKAKSPKDIKKLSFFYKYRGGISERKKLLLYSFNPYPAGTESD